MWVHWLRLRLPTFSFGWVCSQWINSAEWVLNALEHFEHENKAEGDGGLRTLQANSFRDGFLSNAFSVKYTKFRFILMSEK